MKLKLIIFLALILNLNKSFPTLCPDCCPPDTRAKKIILIIAGFTVAGSGAGFVSGSVIGAALHKGAGVQAGVILAGIFGMTFAGALLGLGFTECFFRCKDAIVNRNNIFLAIELRNQEKIKRILRSKPNIIYKVKDFEIPLEFALSSAATNDIIEILINADASYKTIDRALSRFPERIDKAKYLKKILRQKLQALPQVLIDIIFEYQENSQDYQLGVVVEA